MCPARRGSAADRAFHRAVLSSDEPLWLRGHVRGLEQRTAVHIGVTVSRGRVHGPASVGQLRAIAAALPLDIPEVEGPDLWFYPRSEPGIVFRLGGGERFGAS